MHAPATALTNGTITILCCDLILPVDVQEVLIAIWFDATQSGNQKQTLQDRTQ